MDSGTSTRSAPRSMRLAYWHDARRIGATILCRPNFGRYNRRIEWHYRNDKVEERPPRPPGVRGFGGGRHLDTDSEHPIFGLGDHRWAHVHGARASRADHTVRPRGWHHRRLWDRSGDFHLRRGVLRGRGLLVSTKALGVRPGCRGLRRLGHPLRLRHRHNTLEPGGFPVLAGHLRASDLGARRAVLGALARAREGRPPCEAILGDGPVHGRPPDGCGHRLRDRQPDGGCDILGGHPAESVRHKSGRHHRAGGPDGQRTVRSAGLQRDRRRNRHLGEQGYHRPHRDEQFEPLRLWDADDRRDVELYVHPSRDVSVLLYVSSHDGRDDRREMRGRVRRMTVATTYGRRGLTRPMKYRFYYTGIRVRNLTRSLTFYKKAFGMRVVNRGTMPHGGKYVQLEGAGSRQRLELNWDPSGFRFYSPYRRGEEIDHLAFVVDDAEKAYRELIRKGAKPAVPPEKAEGTEVYAQDPDGIWIELLS